MGDKADRDNASARTPEQDEAASARKNADGDADTQTAGSDISEPGRSATEAALDSIRKTEEKLSGLFDRLSNATSTALKIARKTTDKSYKVGKALIGSQDQLKKMSAAGKSLKDLREVAGLTVSELNEALKLKDQSLLEAVENGTAVLSFDLILRLSALLARNDPIPFILKFSRAYAPETWRILNDWGAGRLPTQYQREREFINILRARDDARELTDEGFTKVLEYTRHAFDLSLHFVAAQEAEVRKLIVELTQKEERNKLLERELAQLKQTLAAHEVSFDAEANENTNNAANTTDPAKSE